MPQIDIKKLNELALKPKEMIDASEDIYHKRINEIARSIADSSTLRAVLLAGPSGAGKTTSANLIADAVRSLGEECCVLSLDNFYRDQDDEKYPTDKDGNKDYECPEALDLPALKETLKRITDGKSFDVPKYDFKLGKKTEITKHPASPDGCVIIEGLHALNPLIYESLPPDRIMKLFVSVSTNITCDGERILSGRKIRFVRRLVRDSIFRGADASRTLYMWRGVLAAEDIYLYPYKHLADTAFDTFHMFELGAMRELAKSTIERTEAKEDGYAKTVLNALEKIAPVNPALIPKNSLIREFLAGGIYEDIY